jgi:hypothetical protein
MLFISIYNIISRYCLIRTIDALITQLLSPEVILEPKQETTNDILVFDLITLIYESMSSNEMVEEHPRTPMAGGTTKPLVKKNAELV